MPDFLRSRGRKDGKEAVEEHNGERMGCVERCRQLRREGAQRYGERKPVSRVR